MSGLLTLGRNATHPSAPAAEHDHLYFYSDDKLYRMASNGTPVEVGAAGGGSNTTIVTLGSDASNSTTSYADVTGLSFSVTSGTTYRFYAIITYTVPSSLASLWSLNGPALTRAEWLTRHAPTSGATIITTSHTGYDSGFSNTSTTQGLVIIEGFVLPSASGTLAVRFQSGTGGTAVTAKAGSTLTYW